MIFPGYVEMSAPSDSDIIAKWDRVRLDLVAPPVAAITLNDIRSMNANVNFMVRYRTEQVGSDVWQKPQETLDIGIGDCEDYAIVKYASLLSSGIHADRLCIAIGKFAYGKKPPHACLAFHYINDQWYVLDNQFDDIVPASHFVGFVPLKGIHGGKAILFAKQFTMQDVLRSG